MALGTVLVAVGVLVLSVVAALYLYYLKQFRYWASVNVPVVTEPRFPFGDYTGAGSTKQFGVITEDIYKKSKGHRFIGFWVFFKPALLIRDPELIKHVFVKDFNHFRDRGVYVNEKDDPLSAHLFAIGGSKWRNLRAKMTPTFTSGKMKMMFPTILEASQELVAVLREAAVVGDTVEVKDLTARFTTDVISSCAFGIQTNSLKNPNAIFRVMGRKVFETGFVPTMRIFLPIMAPKVAELTRIKFVTKEVSDFFLNAVRETIDYREQNGVKRNDFMQLLMQLKSKGVLDDVDDTKDKTEKTPITFEDAAAQAFVFFIAGFETSSTTLQFALYELSKHPEIQEKCREEISRILAKHGNTMTYESLHDMEYLGRVIDETLRMYPVVTTLSRECNTPYRIPDTDIVVQKGTMVQISTIGVHHDPEHYPDPERFDPGRFTEEEKAKRHHFAYLPFGEGPRNCIGARFGLMQVKIGLVALLSNYRFQFAPETPNPLVISPKQFVYTTEGGIPLKITKC